MPVFLLLMQSAISSSAQQPIDILFVGNSFTHGHAAPAQYYNSGAITDANGTGYGGVPAIFKQLTLQEGLAYNVTIEAVSSENLQWHFQNKAGVIGRPWDVVVLQEQSLMPLPSAHGGNPGLYATGVANLTNLIRTQNPAAAIYLYETWASPASVATQGYAGSLQAMQNDLQAGTYGVFYDLGLTGVARVGDAFLRAVDQGVADPDPSNGIDAGKINLWAADNRHAGAYGSYLSAAVFYAEMTGADPRSLSVGAGSAASGLGLDATAAENLNRIAYEITALADPPPAAPAPEPKKSPVSAAVYSGSVSNSSPRAITGNATIGSVTTSEGTFSNLVGATANDVVTSNTVSSVGTLPISAAAAVSGLTVNDGVNNLQAGNFQFATTLDADTRFFLIESAPQSSALGDSATITLIDANNVQVGTFRFTLAVSDFTASAANNTSNALATVTYTSGQGTLTAKLGGVSFAFADFTGTGDLSQVTGLRIVSATLDPNVVGMYSVPEPGTASLALGAFMLLAGRRRR